MTKHDKISDIVFAQGMVKFEDFKPEIEAIEADGFKIIKHIVLDYGRTIGLVLEKGMKFSTIMLRECFYDTDLKGDRVKWHGVIDIRKSPWSNKLRS